MRLSGIIDRKAEILSQLDPNRIYVENIRSFFNLPYRAAKFLCEMAVRQKYFRKKYGIICPNEECSRLIRSFDKKSEIPSHIACNHCEHLERENYEFDITKNNIREFYQLTDRE